MIPFGGGSSVVGGIEADANTRDNYQAVVSLDLCHLKALLIPVAYPARGTSDTWF